MQNVGSVRLVGWVGSVELRWVVKVESLLQSFVAAISGLTYIEDLYLGLLYDRLEGKTCKATSCKVEHLAEWRTGNIKEADGWGEKICNKRRSAFFPSSFDFLFLKEQQQKRLILLVAFSQQNLPASQLRRWRSPTLVNPGQVTTANTGHWPKPGGGKLPLLLISTSLEIALLSGGPGFLPCQSGVGCSCAARRLPDCCANHVDEESSCAWREFQLREPDALCVIAKCNISYEQTFGFLPFFFLIVTLSRESRDW